MIKTVCKTPTVNIPLNGEWLIGCFLHKMRNKTKLSALATSLFFFQLIYFNWRIITLQYCDGFCHTSNMNQPQVYTCPHHPEPPSHLPPYCFHLGCSRAPALGALFHASNLHWSHILHMVMYTFQCHSLNSFHPCLLPLSPKVCSLYLCLFAALHIGLSVLSLLFIILLDAPAKEIRQEKK